MASSEKKALRTVFLERRKGLPPEEYARRSQALIERLLELPEIQQARVVHMYWPVLERGEPDLRTLWHTLRAQGKQIAVPVMAGKRPPRLKHVLLEHLEQLRPGPWGIAEPASGREITPEAIDAVIVPALAVDRSGYRLGYGGGYYDAFLQEVHAPKIAAIFSDFLVDTLPHEPHDIPVDLIVTEDETIRLSHRKAGYTGLNPKS